MTAVAYWLADSSTTWVPGCNDFQRHRSKSLSIRLIKKKTIIKPIVQWTSHYCTLEGEVPCVTGFHAQRPSNAESSSTSSRLHDTHSIALTETSFSSDSNISETCLPHWRHILWLVYWTNYRRNIKVKSRNIIRKSMTPLLYINKVIVSC